jgi:hypothetical protein
VLYKKLEKLGSEDKVMGIVERMKWPFKRDEYRNTMETLQRFVKIFSFTLQIQNG